MSEPLGTPLPIAVWRFQDAPQYLQDLSLNCGDEDWLAVVPDYLTADGTYIPWLETSAFGCCCIDTYPHPAHEGFEVVIGSHS